MLYIYCYICFDGCDVTTKLLWMFGQTASNLDVIRNRLCLCAFVYMTDHPHMMSIYLYIVDVYVVPLCLILLNGAGAGRLKQSTRGSSRYDIDIWHIYIYRCHCLRNVCLSSHLELSLIASVYSAHPHVVVLCS